MLDEPHPPAKNPLRQIIDAFLALRRVRVQQDLLFIRYATSLTLCDLELRQQEQLDSSMRHEIKDALLLLCNSLSEATPHIQQALQSIEDNAPLFTLELDFSQSRVRKDGALFLQNIGEMLDNTYKRTERLQMFRSHIADFSEFEEVGAKGQIDALLETIDEALLLSNRHWFCCKDLETNLRRALLGMQI